ncbi:MULTISPECIES: flagellinolysin [Pseudomonadaceae]|nr:MULTISPECIES: flagellinolysin [Pseudomonas]QZX85991.1 flagellinolysin [Pseudomonas otitidis]
MMLTVNTNTASSFTQRQLGDTNRTLDRAMQRLSTGQRINSAKDDAAGLQISNALTSQVRGLGIAVRNANDGLSMLQVGEGALQSVTGALQRIRTLGLQAMNGSNTATERAALNQEAQQLLQEINRVNETTTFGGRQVFNQDNSSRLGKLDERAVLNSLQGFWIGEGEKRVLDAYGLKADGAPLTITLTNDPSSNALASVSGTPGAGGKYYDQVLNVNLAYFDGSTLPNGGTNPGQYTDRVLAHEMVHAVMGRTMNFNALPGWFKEGTAEAAQGADERLAGDIAASGIGGVMGAFGSIASSAGYSASYAAVRYMHAEIKAAGGLGIRDVMQYLAGHANSTLDDALANASRGAFASTADFTTKFNTDGAAFIAAMNLTNADTGAIGGFDADGGDVLTAENVLPNRGVGVPGSIGFKLIPPKLFDPNATGGGTQVSLQVGAKAFETIDVGLDAFNVGAMALNNIDLIKTPGLAVMDIDDALAYVDSQRAYMGAIQNRLDATISNLQNIGENVSASRSRILDADYASETATLASQQILRQAAQSVLVQANQIPQSVLTLLR